MICYEDTIELLCHHHATLHAAARRLRRRVAGDRKLTLDQRQLGCETIDAFLQLNPASPDLQHGMISPIVVATDICASRSWIGLEGRYLVSKNIGWTAAGRPKHACLPLITDRDLH